MKNHWKNGVTEQYRSTVAREKGCWPYCQLSKIYVYEYCKYSENLDLKLNYIFKYLQFYIIIGMVEVNYKEAKSIKKYSSVLDLIF